MYWTFFKNSFKQRTSIKTYCMLCGYVIVFPSSQLHGFSDSCKLKLKWNCLIAQPINIFSPLIYIFQEKCQAASRQTSNLHLNQCILTTDELLCCITTCSPTVIRILLLVKYICDHAVGSIMIWMTVFMIFVKKNHSCIL